MPTRRPLESVDDAHQLTLRIADAYRVGNTVPLIDGAAVIREWLERQDPKARDSRVVDIRATAAHAYLKLWQPDLARKCLGSLVTKSGKIARAGMTALAKADRACAGRLALRVALLNYRTQDYALASESVKTAIEHFSNVAGNSKPWSSTMLKYEAQILDARCTYRLESIAEARALVRRVMGEVHAMPMADWSVDYILAEAHELIAYWAYRYGNFASARSNILIALRLLSSHRIAAPIRLGHALFVAGRVEATVTTDGVYVYSLGCLADALEVFTSREFEEDHHPLARRVLVQRAQTLVKSGRLDDAEESLAVVEKQLKSVGAGEGKNEATYIAADIRLARIWIAERRDDSKERARLATELYGMRELLPVRLEVEGHLHYGRTLYLNGDVARGRDVLRKAIEPAHRNRLTKLDIALRIATAESHAMEARDSVTDEEGIREYRHAQKMLEQSPSDYMSKWLKEFSGAYADEVVVRFSVGVPLAESLEAVELEYLKKVAAADMTQPEAAERLGRSVSWLKARLKHHGISWGADAAEREKGLDSG